MKKQTDVWAKIGTNEPPNYINMRLGDNKLTITTVIDHKALAWIEYDAEQLDELIIKLQDHRKQMKGKS